NRVGQFPRLSVPDLDSRALPGPGGQPPAIRTEGGKAQIRALDDEFAAGILQIIEEGMAGLWAVGAGSTIGTQSEIGAIPPEQGRPGRQAEGLRGTNPQAARSRVRGDRPAPEPPVAVGDQALALGVKGAPSAPTSWQGREFLIAFASGRQIPELHA